MPTFNEISNKLDQAMQVVSAKKDIFDNATIKVTNASNEYEEAVNSAVLLREQLETALNELLPTYTHVRKSG